MKNIIALSCIILLNAAPLHAKVWKSVNHGYWTDTTVWGTSVAPSYLTNDTFIIEHYIHFQQYLTFQGPSRIRVEASGTLCGIVNLKFTQGVVMTLYGNMFADSIFVFGSNINAYGPAKWGYCSLMHLSGGGGFSNSQGASGGHLGNGCFCQVPEGPPTSVNEETAGRITVFPNPANGIYNILINEDLPLQYFVYDLSGKMIRKRHITSIENKIDLLDHPDGLYVVLFYSNGDLIQRHKLVKN